MPRVPRQNPVTQPETVVVETTGTTPIAQASSTEVVARVQAAMISNSELVAQRRMETRRDIQQDAVIGGETGAVLSVISAYSGSHPVPKLNPALKTLNKVVSAILEGRSVVDCETEISKLIHGQEQRAELIDNLVSTAQYPRLTGFLAARETLEATLLNACMNDALTPLEKLAFLKYVNEEIKPIMTNIKAGTPAVRDIMGLVNKIDFAVTVAGKELDKKLSKTTPQGREMVRKTAHKMLKAIKTVIPD